MQNFQIILTAVLGGFIPAVFWLIFWLREDRVHPEPKKMLVETFIAGMSSIIIVWPLESLAQHLLNTGIRTTLGSWILWAAIEEIVKFAACYYVALRRRDDDEPIDAVIYMIVIALGFAALENTLYLLDSVSSLGDPIGMLTLGGSRFIGASLLHILSSAIVGIFFAYSFYKPGIHRKINTIIGLFFAILVHTLFNISMIERAKGGILISPSGNSILILFALIWMGIIGVIVVLEKIKLLEMDSSIIKIEV